MCLWMAKSQDYLDSRPSHARSADIDRATRIETCGVWQWVFIGMYLLHGTPWLKDNQHLLQLKTYLFLLKASSSNRGITPRFLSCQDRGQDTNLRLWEAGGSNNSWLLAQFRTSFRRRPFGSNSLVIPPFDCFSWGISNPAHRPMRSSCFPFPFLISFLVSKCVHSLHKVMSDQTELAHTYSLPHRRRFNYVKLSGSCISCGSQSESQAWTLVGTCISVHLTFQEVLGAPRRIWCCGSPARAMLQVRGLLTRTHRNAHGVNPKQYRLFW